MMLEPARGKHRGVQEETGDTGARYKQWLQVAGANIADEDNADFRVLVVVRLVVVVDDPMEEEAEEHANPHKG